VQIDEPSEQKAILMARGVASTLEQHHRVQVLDEALESAVRLSHRYIPSRQLPDKAVSLLDTACARVAISQSAVPAEVEDCRRRIEALETELEIIARETAVGVDTAEREAAATAKLESEREHLAGLEERWERENTLVKDILDLRARLRGQRARVEGTGSELEEAAEEAASTGTVPAEGSEGAPGGAEDGDGEAGLSEQAREEALAELRARQVDLHALQGETPLILPSVDGQAVASVVADWTGIPVGRMVKDEVKAVLSLADTLNRRVIGQRHALDMIASRIQTSRARLDNPNKPIGVFLLAGPSGVGKTETGLALAEALYGGEQNIITINMSEFQEAHTVSTLKGSPPGYVGYGEGGILTEAVRRKPYSVVLLDEVEKAHPDVHEIFFQVFDKGWMEDAEGRNIDFRNTLILLTTNVGTDLIMGLCKDPDLMPEPEGIATALREPLLKTFPAALLGRLVAIPYFPLNDEMLAAIIRLQLGRVARRIEENHRIDLSYTDGVVDLIGARCAEVESGARVVDAILTNTLLPEISRELLTREMEGRRVASVSVDVGEDGFSYGFVDAQ
jgi:type VI secretion system protein VasG